MKKKKTAKIKSAKPLKKGTPVWPDLLLLTIPILLFVAFYTLSTINKSLRQQITHKKVTTDLQDITIHPYPVVNTLFDPTISAQSAIIMDNTSKAILYEKNATVRFSMASTTKLMTALTALEYYKPTDILTVYNTSLPEAKVGFGQGEQVYFQDMLYGLLLPSGNDAAYALADNYPGGMSAFVKRMNEKAKLYHLQNTSFGDPAGLEDDLDFTTVVDLARLTSIALQNPTIAQIISTKEYQISDVWHTKEYDLHNLNKLLGTDGVTGVKTGFTEGAGGVLITSKVQKGHTFIIIVMKSKDRFIDTEHLLSLLDQGDVNYIQPVFTPLGLGE